MEGAKIRAAVAGAHGKMGVLVIDTLRAAPDIAYVGGLVRKSSTAHGSEYADIDRLLADARPEVLVDFTHFPDSKALALACIERGVRPVIGTSGYGEADIAQLRDACAAAHVGAVFAPNFALGAVLMMRFAQEAAPYFGTVEIVEMHESGKHDAPSGTAMATARRLAGVRSFERSETKLVRAQGARGASLDGIGIHSLRMPGVVAHQEVVFGGHAETLRICHDSFSRASFMEGVLLAVRKAPKLDRFVEGLEALL